MAEARCERALRVPRSAPWGLREEQGISVTDYFSKKKNLDVLKSSYFGRINTEEKGTKAEPMSHREQLTNTTTTYP